MKSATLFAMSILWCIWRAIDSYAYGQLHLSTCYEAVFLCRAASNAASQESARRKCAKPCSQLQLHKTRSAYDYDASSIEESYITNRFIGGDLKRVSRGLTHYVFLVFTLTLVFQTSTNYRFRETFSENNHATIICAKISWCFQVDCRYWGSGKRKPWNSRPHIICAITFYRPNPSYSHDKSRGKKSIKSVTIW